MYHLANDVVDGGVYAGVEAGGVWEISVLPSQFCFKPKTALKKLKS